MNHPAQAAIPPATRMLAAAFAVVLLALTPGTASATDVRLVNYVAYTYNANVADLQTDGVQNFDPDSPTYALRLELWAFSSPYTAGMAGTRLAVYQMPALGAAARTGKIDSGPVAFRLPANGVWYFSMLLTELTGPITVNDGYEVRDWINFPKPEYIGVPPPPAKVTAVEFYNAGLDHYFVAATAQDIFDLDTGVQQGWSRTGESFVVWDGATGNAGPVCRYYIPPGYGDSHFFSASAEECDIALVKFPFLIKETDAAFYIALPDSGTGACLINEIPIYRLWNARADSNHRYTASAATKAAMIAKGYVAEGYGPDQVDMCAPQ